MANEEEVLLLQLYDFYWFEYEILRNKTKPSLPINPALDMREDQEFEPSPLMKLSHTPSFIVRSFSDQALSSTSLLASNSTPSPKSVLPVPKLETILSGKEVAGEFPSEPAGAAKIINIISDNSDGGKIRRRRRRGGNGSRSLSELEFEEIKGFMDLGFVFSDEDRDYSSLASIIPGLQRLGKRAAGSGCRLEENDEDKVSRPYLSEAWDADEMRVKKQLMNWRISAAGNNDLEIKNQIRFWAHTVASTVR